MEVTKETLAVLELLAQTTGRKRTVILDMVIRNLSWELGWSPTPPQAITTGQSELFRRRREQGTSRVFTLRNDE